MPRRGLRCAKRGDAPVRRRRCTSSASPTAGRSRSNTPSMPWTDSRLAQADRLILVSPMIGITSFARFAGLAALPAMFPAFAKAAWLGILPEFNPFKYNSFPVNGAVQSHRLTVALQDRLARAAREDRLQRMPPILTFQSVVDFTVSTPRRHRLALCPVAGQWQRARAVRSQPRRQDQLRASAQRFRDRPDADPGRSAAQLPNDDHRQRRRRSTGGPGTRDRSRRHDGAGARPRSRLSARPLLAVACRAALPDVRRALRPAARRAGEFRRQPRRHRARGASAAC